LDSATPERLFSDMLADDARPSTFQLPLDGKREFHITSLGSPLLDPDSMRTLTDEVLLLQPSRRRLEFTRQIAHRPHRGRVADLYFKPSIAFGPLPKLACFLHGTLLDRITLTSGGCGVHLVNDDLDLSMVTNAIIWA
jgi:hypothetical protein